MKRRSLLVIRYVDQVGPSLTQQHAQSLLSALFHSKMNAASKALVLSWQLRAK